MQTKQYISTILFISLLFLTSCISTKYVSSSFKAKEVLKIGIMPSIIGVGIIKEKNNVEIDSLTITTTEANLVQNIKTVFGEKVEKVEIIQDSLSWRGQNELLSVINQYLRSAANQAQRNSVIQNYSISSNLDSVMNRQQLDFMTFNIHQGFKRTKENYTKQSIKGAGVGLLTLGMAVPIYYPHNSFLVSVVIDKKRKKIVFLNYNSLQINPLELNTTYNQFCQLYLDVFTFETNGQCYHK